MSNLAADRADLRHLVESYAAACDGRDLALLQSCFVEGGSLTVHQPGRGPSTMTTPADLDRVPSGLGRYDHTFHLVGNHRVDIDGDQASGDTYCVAHHVQGDVDLVIYIRYEDRYQRTDAGWRIATRDVRMLWTSRQPVEPA
ncbi:MAG: nuclear transport factor 2 family protein [Actinomycetota bacterium]